MRAGGSIPCSHRLALSLPLATLALGEKAAELRTRWPRAAESRLAAGPSPGGQRPSAKLRLFPMPGTPNMATRLVPFLMSSKVAFQARRVVLRVNSLGPLWSYGSTGKDFVRLKTCTPATAAQTKEITHPKPPSGLHPGPLAQRWPAPG